MRVQALKHDLEQNHEQGHYALRFVCSVGAAGLEPATPASQTRCATELRYTPNQPGTPGDGEYNANYT